MRALRTLKFMISRGRKTLGTLGVLGSHLELIERQIEDVKLQQGRILCQLNSEVKSLNINDHEFRVFSQWGEDGVIQHLIRNIDIKNKTFVEFGVQDFQESNCRFLMMHNNWQGYVIDGSVSAVAAMRRQRWFWRHDLVATSAFITRDNIRDLISASGFHPEVGILSVDVDGMDFWILKEIDNITPRIIIVEFNAIFGPERKISVPYSQDFNRHKAHYSGLYFGASLSAFSHLLGAKGYALVGVESAGVNAFFVRRDLLNERIPATECVLAFRGSFVRESRGLDGRRTFLSGRARLDAIRGLPVVNVETGQIEAI